MKTLKKILPIIIILVVIAFIYSFFRIDGQEIKFVDELLEAKIVTVIVMNEKNDDPKVEYDLNREQIKNLKKLIGENTYTRRMSSTISGVLPDKRYTIFANWDDNGKKHLQISLLGGEYIQILGEYGSNYHKIKNSDFEKELISILGDK